ncbi:MAG: ATP-dependent DNA helicase RecG [Gammaproteobacteria bacterium]|nr:MAG: ATP-dependent DNA helicase RecG [Gammaproteobacteria bacterium]
MTLTVDHLAAEPVTALKGVGAALAAKLEKLHIHTIQDVVFHLPLRYEDRTRLTPVAALRPGLSALIEGTVLDARVEMGRKRSLLVTLDDHGARIGLRFYYFNATQKQRWVPGATLRVFGEPRPGRTGLEMYHPEVAVVQPGEPLPVDSSLTPVYPTTEGLPQRRLRQVIQAGLSWLDRCEPEALLPGHLVPVAPHTSLSDALRYLHAPPPDADRQALSEGCHPYQQRLAFEELLAHHLSLLRARQRAQSHAAPVLTDPGNLCDRLLATLHFAPTTAQQRVTREIAADMSRDRPMLRLVQGDVGSGKTLVAALAAARAVSSGYQAAIMAPTDVLAEQHARQFQAWFGPLDVPIVRLSGSMKVRERREALAAVASGHARIVIGTHALFQDDVDFCRLGLVIIDEQHRFGVHQRLSLRDKGHDAGQVPHQLVMTATPIPRTLAMSAYADLDTSIIDELPAGRQPITTLAVSDQRRDQVIDRMRAVCQSGRQAYWVCTLVEESEVLQCQAAEATAEVLREALPELNVGLVHGRLKAAEKQAVMEAFKQGTLHVLVATTVIEVGVDVPNATLMVIENPERLGLAQLHQLRGRVGRGQHESFCVLLYHNPLSATARARLEVMRETTDGFRIAEKDLEIRGPGEVLGTRQTGLVQFRIADLQRDQGMLERVRDVALTLLDDRARCEALIGRWIGAREAYAHV